ncbi:CD209 antigen-like protein C [Trichomycterus rosablanca]|uniref:CD209 antigen-like protein C n=1 Tax=Trichomycterus rosablanca TaxID=2290929 RepID=UPI002F35A238
MCDEIYANAEVTTDQRFNLESDKNSYDNIYINEDELQTGSTRSDQNKKNSGCETAGSRLYRGITVGLLLLCVLLLVVIIVLAVRNKNLTIENDQLQTSYKDLIKEKVQLQTSYKDLIKEKDQLQTSYKDLIKEKDQLQTSYKDLIKEKEQLQKENYKCVVSNLEQMWRYKFGSSLYYFSPGRKDWTESRKDCRDRNADLVIINSLDELNFIMENLVCEHVWVGLSQAPNEGKWTWVDGTELNTNSEYWSSGQPDNHKNSEDCGEVWNTATMTKLNDRNCSYKQMWICEKSAP